MDDRDLDDGRPEEPPAGTSGPPLSRRAAKRAARDARGTPGAAPPPSASGAGDPEADMPTFFASPDPAATSPASTERQSGARVEVSASSPEAFLEDSTAAEQARLRGLPPAGGPFSEAPASLDAPAAGRLETDAPRLTPVPPAAARPADPPLPERGPTTLPPPPRDFRDGDRRLGRDAAASTAERRDPNPPAGEPATTASPPGGGTAPSGVGSPDAAASSPPGRAVEPATPSPATPAARPAVSPARPLPESPRPTGPAKTPAPATPAARQPSSDPGQTPAFAGAGDSGDPELLPPRTQSLGGGGGGSDYAPPPPIRKRRLSATARFYLGFWTAVVLVVALAAAIGFKAGASSGEARGSAAAARTLGIEAQCLRDVKLSPLPAADRFSPPAYARDVYALAQANRCARQHGLPYLSAADLEELSGVKTDPASSDLAPPTDPRWLKPEADPPRAGAATGISVRSGALGR